MPVRFVEWRRINWDALIWHLIAGLLVAVGTGMMQGDNPMHAVKLWFFGALCYIGAYIQNSERKDIPDAPLDPPANPV